jgi:hypothetical protein
MSMVSLLHLLPMHVIVQSRQNNSSVVAHESEMYIVVTPNPHLPNIDSDLIYTFNKTINISTFKISKN